MRIAVISDIHGNLPALEAVVADLGTQAVDEVWCGGDLGWAGPWASECIALVREAGWTTVKGNTDIWISGDPQNIESDQEREAFRQTAHAHAVSDADAEWLLNLPIGHSGKGSILLVHATPESPFVAPLPDAPASEFAPFESRAGLVVYGHIHQAFVRRLTDGTIVANTGAVGLPMDALTACYLVIDQEGPDLTLRHRRVPFDRDAGLARAREMGGPVGELFLRFMGA